MANVTVEVIYACQARVYQALLQVEQPISVLQVIRLSGFIEQFKLDPSTLKIGVFGEKVSFETEVQEGDRLEIYRPLSIEPKQARQKRAQAQKR